MARGVSAFISGLATGFRSVVTVQDLADRAVRALRDIRPDALVAIFERAPTSGDIRPIAGDIGDAGDGCVSSLHLPLVRAAFNKPGEVLTAAAALRPGGATGAAKVVDPGVNWNSRVSCGAVAVDGKARYAVLVGCTNGAEFDSTREAAVEMGCEFLIASSELIASKTDQSRAVRLIRQAKVEWERAADSLPDIFGLIDPAGRVVRVNRTIERWGLGFVRESSGRDLHELLHHDCSSVDCKLAVQIGRAVQQLRISSVITFEVDDPRLGRHVSVSLRSPSGESLRELADRGSEALQPQLCVFVVSDLTELRHAQAKLEAFNRTLEERIEQRTAELASANTELRAEVVRRSEAESLARGSNRELRRLSKKLVNAQEDERKRVAQELHDSVGQSLSAIKYLLEYSQALSERNEATLASERIATAVQRVTHLIDEVREISMNLRPAIIDDLGAASALRFLCREWHDVYRDIAIETHIGVRDEEIPDTLALSVYRGVQESLNNVARHASARNVSVSLERVGDALAVTVHDDGLGLPVERSGDTRDAASMTPLRALRERAEQSGGELRVSSAPGLGTTVCLEWPLALADGTALLGSGVS